MAWLGCAEPAGEPRLLPEHDDRLELRVGGGTGARQLRVRRDRSRPATRARGSAVERPLLLARAASPRAAAPSPEAMVRDRRCQKRLHDDPSAGGLDKPSSGRGRAPDRAAPPAPPRGQTGMPAGRRPRRQRSSDRGEGARREYGHRTRRVWRIASSRAAGSARAAPLRRTATVIRRGRPRRAAPPASVAGALRGAHGRAPSAPAVPSSAELERDRSGPGPVGATARGLHGHDVRRRRDSAVTVAETSRSARPAREGRHDRRSGRCELGSFAGLAGGSTPAARQHTRAGGSVRRDQRHEHGATAPGGRAAGARTLLAPGATAAPTTTVFDRSAPARRTCSAVRRSRRPARPAAVADRSP